MALADDLERVAVAAAGHGPVAGVLAAEPAGGRRVYLVALGDEPRRWLVLDERAQPVTGREEVRDAASIVAMCELAADAAGELGFDAGPPPRLAQPGYLDRLGASLAGRREFTDALRAGTPAVEEFVRDVERGYLLELR